jgi:cytochrome c peroxidase
MEGTMRLSADAIALVLSLSLVGTQAVAQETATSAGADGAIQLPPAPPIPRTPPFLPSLEDPKENPTTPEKVQLGYMLFFEKLLSKDRSMSCESCHHPDLAWTEGRPVSPKVGGALNKRNAPTMLNVAYHTSFYWDGRSPTVEAVSKAAWTGQLGADPASIVVALNTNGTYRAHFMRAFNSPATADNIPMALASFLRALKSGNAPYDKFEQGDKKAVSAEAKRGFQVFRKANCALCHVPPLYTDFQFHNVGWAWDLGDKRDHGRMDATKDPKDDGKFKTPTLRDIAKTAPYFHDGGAKTLDEAIDFMLGGGKKNPNLDEKLKRAKLSKKDKAALKAFLEALTGTATFTRAPELPK